MWAFRASSCSSFRLRGNLCRQHADPFIRFNPMFPGASVQISLWFRINAVICVATFVGGSEALTLRDRQNIHFAPSTLPHSQFNPWLKHRHWVPFSCVFPLCPKSGQTIVRVPERLVRGNETQMVFLCFCVPFTLAIGGTACFSLSTTQPRRIGERNSNNISWKICI